MSKWKIKHEKFDDTNKLGHRKKVFLSDEQRDNMSKVISEKWKDPEFKSKLHDIRQNKIKERAKTIISDFKKVHGDRYDYSKVIYEGVRTKVLIICPEHGEFYQNPTVHKRGGGCKNCPRRTNNKIKERIKERAKTIISDFKKVHGDRYDYSKVIYEGVGTKVSIICKEHGEFTQTPKDHGRGHGCPSCSGTVLKTHGQVIADFKKVHGDRYDYSKVIYERGATKVLIICSKHGVFFQRPDSHLQGRGCPSCSRESRDSINLKDVEELLNKGLTRGEIAAEMGRHPDTIRRKIKLIRSSKRRSNLSHLGKP